MAWWEAREAALRARGPAWLGEALERPEGSLPQGAHLDAACWLDHELLTREVHTALRSWFEPRLLALGVTLEEGQLARARSWLDAVRRVPALRAEPWPSALLGRLRERDRAEAVLYALFDPASRGAGFGRYPERLAQLRKQLSGPQQLRVLDAGAGRGESSWELAAALLGVVERVELLGCDRCPLSVELAQRGRFPHDPAGTAALAAFRAAHPVLEDEARCTIRFAQHDLLDGPPVRKQDLVVCHGVLGESIDAAPELARAVAHLAEALAPGGLLSLCDRFRTDRREAAAEAISTAASAAGLQQLEPGLWLRAKP